MGPTLPALLSLLINQRKIMFNKRQKVLQQFCSLYILMRYRNRHRCITFSISQAYFWHYCADLLRA